MQGKKTGMEPWLNGWIRGAVGQSQERDLLTYLMSTCSGAARWM